MSKNKEARVAIVHPWFIAHGGAEHVVDVLATIFPQADFFTLFYTEQGLPANLRGRKITASKANWIPYKYSIYRYLLGFYPMAFEEIDLRGYDLVITSDSCVAKGAIIDQGARHICYCHSPMRALWDQRFEFREILPVFARPFFTLATHLVRQWDFQAAQRVDYFVANSNYVAERISQYYRRESTVIYPPVVLQSGPISTTHENFYLSVCRLTETKRVDLLVEACKRLNRRLVVVGDGRHAGALQKLAGPTIEFRGRVSNQDLDQLYRGCRALLFAANEDFGIVPVEAQGYGRPVIAYGHGGSLETIVADGQVDSQGLPIASTGVLFPKQTVDCVCEAILRYEATEHCFHSASIRAHAEKFADKEFAKQLIALIAITGADVSQSVVSF